MGPQYPITLGIGMTVPTWYKLGTLTLASGSFVRMFSLQATAQTYQGVPKQLFLDFVSNAGNPVQDTYDATPVAFNAYTRMQTTSPEWYFDGFSTDVAVTQLSNAVYAFYLIVYPNTGTGFFTVRHAPGDSFLFEGVYTGGTRPANGVYPMGLPLTSVDQIGALPINNPTATGLLSCQNFKATGTVDIPANSLTIDDVLNLQTSLNAKANLAGPTTFTGTVTLPSFQTLTNAQLNGTTNSTGSIFANLLGANSSFTSTYGTQASMTAGVSSTIYTLAANSRGFIFLDTDSTNASSTVAYFSNMSGVNYLTILARNGNALGTANLGTAFSGTYNMTVVINSSGNIRVSVVNGGSIRWNVILLSAAV